MSMVSKEDKTPRGADEGCSAPIPEGDEDLKSKVSAITPHSFTLSQLHQLKKVVT